MQLLIAGGATIGATLLAVALGIGVMFYLFDRFYTQPVKRALDEAQPKEQRFNPN